MQTRLSLTAIGFVAFCILLLSNMQEVELKFFLITYRVPLMFVILLSALFGVLTSILFLSMSSGYRKIRARLEKLQNEIFRGNSR